MKAPDRAESLAEHAETVCQHDCEHRSSNRAENFASKLEPKLKHANSEVGIFEKSQARQSAEHDFSQHSDACERKTKE